MVDAVAVDVQGFAVGDEVFDDDAIDADGADEGETVLDPRFVADGVVALGAAVEAEGLAVDADDVADGGVPFGVLLVVLEGDAHADAQAGQVVDDGCVFAQVVILREPGAELGAFAEDGSRPGAVNGHGHADVQRIVHGVDAGADFERAAAVGGAAGELVGAFLEGFAVIAANVAAIGADDDGHAWTFFVGDGGGEESECKYDE